MPAIIAMIEFKGNSGKNYSFNVCSLSEELPNESVIYVFTKRSLNTATNKYEHNIYFIGSAPSLPDSNYTLQKKHCIARNAANSVCYMQIPIEAERKIIECDLLKGNITLCNEVSNAGVSLNISSFLPKFKDN